MALKLLLFFLSPPFSAHTTRAAPAHFHPQTTSTANAAFPSRRPNRAVSASSLQHAHGFREFRDSEIEELHLRNVSGVFILVTLSPAASQNCTNYCKPLRLASRTTSVISGSVRMLTLLTSLPTSTTTAIHQRSLIISRQNLHFGSSHTDRAAVYLCLCIDSIFCPLRESRAVSAVCRSLVRRSQTQFTSCHRFRHTTHGSLR